MCCMVVFVCYLFFYFKQKTAYEMRISDWSSDVCSSDLSSRPRYLDADALDTPSVALAGAARETLRMGDLVESMLRRSIDVFRTDDAKLAEAIEAEDDGVDSLNEAIKLYLTGASQAGDRKSTRLNSSH